MSEGVRMVLRGDGYRSGAEDDALLDESSSGYDESCSASQ